jgi:hypothetical protein
MTTDSAPAPAGDVPDVAKFATRRTVRVWLKRGAIGVVALALAALIGGYFLPREVEVTRSIDIAQPRAAVFPLAADLRHLADWSPWLAGDPGVAITYTGPLDGVGQTVRWDSKLPAVASGTVTITAIEPDQTVEMRVTRAGQPVTGAWFRLTDKAAGETTVVWGYREDLGFNPVSRYRGLAIDGAVGADYERGLRRLQAFAEAPPKTDPPAAN